MECVYVGAPVCPNQAGGKALPGGSPSQMGAEKGKGGHHVNFNNVGEVKEKREKFLTAKYGSHQMNLIRKRLNVEMWIYDSVHNLYNYTDDSASHQVDVDLDEILDIEQPSERRIYLQNLLLNARKSQEEVNKFIDELLERAGTL